MTLKQLRYLCEIVQRGLHLSRAAEALHTSQPGVSAQLQLLERELGLVIFNRKRNRLLGLTPAGEEVHRYAQRTLQESENIRSVSQEFGNELTGNLVIATTHTQARYALPSVIRKFRRKYPRILLEFWLGTREEVFRRVESDQADVAIGTDGGARLDGVSLLPYGQLRHSIVTCPGHELLQTSAPTLETVAKHPLITHAFDGDGQWKFAKFFESRGLHPNIIFRAVDADVCKAYIELGMGISILASVAYNKSRDRPLKAISADHLFEPETLCVGLNRRRFHRQYVYEFIDRLSPSLTREKIEHALG